MRALLIGSIGVVTETSDHQRQAYNEALATEGLDWHWDENTYRQLLSFSGGMARLEMLAATTGQSLPEDQVKRIHSTKTRLACERIQEEELQPRDGIVSLIKQAREMGLKVFWVTSTNSENTSAILAAARDLSEDDFDQIYFRDDVSQGKPAPDIYLKVLQDHQLEPEDVLAIEDSLPSLLSARRAGIRTISYPGAMHDDSTEGIADDVCHSGKDLTAALSAA